MESKPFCWVLLAFFILLCFVAQTHGRMKEQGLHHLYKSILKPDFGLDTSLFQAADLIVDQTNVFPQRDLKERDWIKAWPGQPPVKFSQYSGYVTVNKAAGRTLYYYLAEAQQYKDTLPLLLWLNGGNPYIIQSTCNVMSLCSNKTPVICFSYFFEGLSFYKGDKERW
jgi:serine carboxypeptidase-like clade 2